MKKNVDYQSLPAWFGPHAGIRTDGYLLLAAFLTGPPSEYLIGLVRHMDWNEGLSEKMCRTLSSLSLAGSHCPRDNIVGEFNLLFVGLGRGELVPYGSWYLEKTIQSAPLAAIRSDLARFGIVRQTDSFESEDHAGALCEIMALLNTPESGVEEDEQAVFFDQHIEPWLPDFFLDLRSVAGADFYRTVGDFGCCFLEMERDYLKDLPDVKQT